MPACLLEQFRIENVDCSGRRESGYPQPNTRENHAFSDSFYGKSALGKGSEEC